MPLSVIRRIVTRRYTDFRGIDLLNPETSVDYRRSPDCLNVWKSYNLEQSNIIETRPGIKLLRDLSDDNETNNKIYSMYIWDTDTVIVHIGKKLLKWDGFPDSENPTITTLKSNMNEKESIMFFFKSNLYILDGANYLIFNGSTLSDVSTNAYVPTTTIGRSPSGGGEKYQDVNLLTASRKNAFKGDGTTKKFVLDIEEAPDSIVSVEVNESTTTAYTWNNTDNYITFTTAPSSSNEDNVIIEFSKAVSGYSTRIPKCTIARVFDNRIFFSGNPDFPNGVFHSELNKPSYVSDLSYYECGTNDNPVKSMVVGNNLLWVFKKDAQTKDTIFYLTPTIDAEEGRIYPTSQGNVSVGCISKAVNYKDSLLFFSRNGMEGIRGNINYEQSVTHKSSLIDTKLINMDGYEDLKLAEFNGYLVVAIDNLMFLADYRQVFQGTTGTEYEWYLWNLPVNITCLKDYQNKLYFGDEDGSIYEFTGTNDLNEAILSYWITPRDAFGYMQHLKKINKRGAILKIKNIQNSRLKIAEKTNKANNWALVKETSGNGFDFEHLDFENLSFESGDNTYVVFRIKEKKIIDLSLKVYSDMKDKPFGLSEINIEAFISGYVKRS